MTRNGVRSQRGFTYIGAMVAVIIMGITLGAAGTFWATRMKREREAELIWRGIQYRDAIRAWYWYRWDPNSKSFKTDTEGRTKAGLPQQVPLLTELDQLLKDPNRTQTVHYLRKLYTDPVKSFETGKPEKWAVVRGTSQEIIGVKSTSEAKPIKQANFPDDPMDGLNPADFEGKEKYSDWQFIYNRVAPLPGTGGQKGLGGSSTPGGSSPGSGTPPGGG